MEHINNLLGSLYKGDNEGATEALNKAMESKKDEALKIKKVAIASETFNKR